MKYYMVKDNEGWVSGFLFKTKEEAREKIRNLMFDPNWYGVENFVVLCIDTRVMRIDEIESIER